jgi:hypothetical protein
MEKRQVILYFQGFRYQIGLSEEKPTLIGSDHQADLHVVGLPTTLTVTFADGWRLTYLDQDKTVTLEQPVKVTLAEEQTATVILAPVYQREIYDILDKQELILDAAPGATLQLQENSFSGILKKQQEQWTFLLLDGEVLVNNHQFSGSECQLEKGDELAFASYTLKIFPHEVHVTKGAVLASQLCQILIRAMMYIRIILISTDLHGLFIESRKKK